MDSFSTPNKRLDLHSERTKRFTRKPFQKSQRSSSKKSYDSQIRQMYIRSPTSISKQKLQEKGKPTDFLATLAQSLISNADKRHGTPVRYRERYSQREQYETRKKEERSTKNYVVVQQRQNYPHIPYLNLQQPIHSHQSQQLQSSFEMKSQIHSLLNKVKILQADIEVKNHELLVATGDAQRYKLQFQQEKDKRRKAESERRQISRQLRQINRNFQALKLQQKKNEGQKEHLLKQIQFLQRINYDEKTRNLQSYRQTYLQSQLQKTRSLLSQSKSSHYQELQSYAHELREQKHTIQSHYKAMKIANQCLVKQIKYMQEHIQDIVMNSEQYKKLREKYVKFLQAYKQLRNQNWALQAELDRSSNKKDSNDSSSLFSISAQQIQADLTSMKNSMENPSPVENLGKINQIMSMGEIGKSKSLIEEIKKQLTQPECIDKKEVKI